MYKLTSNITITDPTGASYLEYLPIIEVKINKSRRTLTNTAKITMPRNLKVLNGDINTIIKRGSAVNIQLGYDGNLTTRFTGFVSQVNAQIPFTIDCQDTMWTLKQNSFTKTWKKGTKVAEIVKYIYTGRAAVVDLSIGGLLVVKQSTAQILDGLKKFGLQCYFGNDANGVNTLYVDFAGAVHGSGNEIFYNFYQNILDNKLDYKRKEDSRIKVIGVSKLANGKKIQLVTGDNDGEIHTLNYSYLDASQLQLIINAEIDTLKYEGFKGTFTTWGLPEIEPGDIAVLDNPLYPEQNGSYLTEAVEITFGAESGYRHEVTPERKVA
jgi:hypothetical protein